VTLNELTAAFWLLDDDEREEFLERIRPATPEARRLAKDAARKRSLRASRPGNVRGPSADNPRTNTGMRPRNVPGQSPDVPPQTPLSDPDPHSVSGSSDLVIVSSSETSTTASARATASETSADVPGHSADWITVGKAYGARWERATKDAWMALNANQRDLADIGMHCRAVATKRQVSFSSVVDSVLDGAFANAWMRSNGWPISAIAKNPGRFALPARGLSSVAPHAAFGDPDAPVTDAEVDDVFEGRLGRAKNG